MQTQKFEQKLSKFGIHFCLIFTALRIHISQCTADILVQAGSFELEERGEIEMKVTPKSAWVFFLIKMYNLCFTSVYLCPWQGKGCHKTYWLLRKQGFNPVIAQSSPPADSLKLQPEVTHIMVRFMIKTTSSICSFLCKAVLYFHLYLWSPQETRNNQTYWEKGP